MRKNSLFYTLAAISLFSLAFHSCKKENGIDNNQVVKKPYGLYVVDDQGTLYNTNDGDDYKEIIFPSDGFPSRSIATPGNNLIWVKAWAYISDNNGRNFNPLRLKDGVNLINPPLPGAVNHSSLIYNIPDWNRVYMAASGQGRANTMYSDNFGLSETWIPDSQFTNNIQQSNAAITSFVRLNNGTLFGLDFVNNKIFKKRNKDDIWEDVAYATKFPNGREFFLSKLNNTLLAGDISGTTGVWYSTDEGKNWQQYSGLPARPVLALHSPFGQSVLAGTDSAGVYRLKGTTFEPSNAGLGQNASVRAIVEKDNLYKNEVRKQFVFLATDKGVYRSEDLGLNWVLVKPGNYVGAH